MTDLRKSFFQRIQPGLLIRVLVVYVAVSAAVLEVVSIFRQEFGLPGWFFPAAVALLLIGLPIILATAMVQEGLRKGDERVPLPEFDLEGEASSAEEPGGEAAASPASPKIPTPLNKLLTWRWSILGGVLAFALLAVIGVIVALRGSARVTDAYGAAGGDFMERAWIVVADFEGPADEPDLAAAVREALVLDLQQSRYVNVFTRSQTSGALAYMGRPDTVTVDAELAREIAQREGLAAVLAGSISELGGDLVLGGRVVRPATGEELIVVKTTAARGRLVEAVEALSREIRARLGESKAAIRTSKPLPDVTTRSLEALQSYARAVNALARGDTEEALSLAEEAIEIDPEFAMAYRLAGVAHSNQRRFAESRRLTEHAYQLRDELSHRERLHIEARYADIVLSDLMESIEKYQLILSTYPDDARAANNLAAVANRVGDYERAHRSGLRTIELNPYLAPGYYNAITSAIQLAKWSVADSLIELTLQNGLEVWGTRAVLYWGKVLEKDWGRADALCDSLLTQAPAQSQWLGYDAAVCGGFDAAHGRMGQALDRWERASRHFGEREQYSFYHWTTNFIVQGEVLRGRPESARQRLQRALSQYPLDSVAKPDWFDAVLSAGIAATHAGDLALAERLAAAFAADTTDRMNAAWLLRLQTALKLNQGEYQAALEHDRRAIRRHFGRRVLIDQLYRAQAFDGLERWDSAVALYEDAISPRHIPSLHGIESVRYLTHLPLVHRRLGELYEIMGEAAKAAEHYQVFIELWRDCDSELRPQLEAARRALERLGAEGTGRASASGALP